MQAKVFNQAVGINLLVLAKPQTCPFGLAAVQVWCEPKDLFGIQTPIAVSSKKCIAEIRIVVEAAIADSISLYSLLNGVGRYVVAFQNDLLANSGRIASNYCNRGGDKFWPRIEVIICHYRYCHVTIVNEDVIILSERFAHDVVKGIFQCQSMMILKNINKVLGCE